MSRFDSQIGFDPVAAFLRRPINEVISPKASPSSEPAPAPERSIHALQLLAAQYAWAAVLELATSLLADEDEAEESSTSLQPDEKLVCEAYRALALLQTRQIDRAADAVAQLGPLDDSNKAYRYETYPAIYPPDKHPAGSFVPFELRLLAIDIRIRQADVTAVPDCYALKRTLGRPTPGDPRHELILSALASYHLRASQHDAVVDVARQLVALRGADASSLYTYARVLLHVGDLESAERVLARARTAEGSTDAVQLAHKGMLLAARCGFQEALMAYDAALAAEKAEGEDGELRSPRNLWVFVSNNAAICLMHLGRLAEAIDRLEGALRREPEVALDEGLVFNLTTLYDLAYPDSATEKKLVLRKLASRFGRQGFDLEKISL